MEIAAALEERPSTAPRNLAAMISAAVLLSAALFDVTPLVLKELTIEEVMRALGRIFFVAAIFERALEVMITTWRGPGAERLEGGVDEVEAKLRWVEKDAGLTQVDREKRGEVLLPEHAQARTLLSAYRAETRSLALWTAFVLGACLAAVGVRVLDPLLQAPPPAGLQRSAFVFLDCLMSGAAIAGGSAGIHAILQSFVDFFEAQSRKVKAVQG